MKTIISLALCTAALLLSACFGSNAALKLGDSPLTVTVKADDETFDGYANVYINGNFVGTTDRKKGSLGIRLESGEYTLMVTADGYEPWKSSIFLLGKGYEQRALARLRKEFGGDIEAGGGE
jgi:hypothetical protein